MAEVVSHIQNDERRKAERQDRRGQHQVAAGDLVESENQQHSLGTSCVGALAGEHVVRNLFVFGARRKAIHTRKVDDLGRARPSGSATMPVCCSTVTPGKLATF